MVFGALWGSVGLFGRLGLRASGLGSILNMGRGTWRFIWVAFCEVRSRV